MGLTKTLERQFFEPVARWSRNQSALCSFRHWEQTHCPWHPEGSFRNKFMPRVVAQSLAAPIGRPGVRPRDWFRGVSRVEV
jgi:hypothetical protein